MQNKVGKFKTKEIQGECFTIESHEDMYQVLEENNGNKEWVDAEFKERISSELINPGEAYKLREDVWNEFLNDGQDGKFGYTYNERIRYQLEDTIELLKRDPFTRQAVITLYEGEKDTKHRGGKIRVPCSMHYQFFINEVEDLSTGEKQKVLDVLYSIRSNDFGTHFLYDLVLACKLGEYIAEKVGVSGNGRLIYQGGSLHYYVDKFKHVM